MSLRRVAVFAVLATLMAPQAFAQDDLLVPLETSKPEPKSKKKPAKKSAKRRPGKKEKQQPVATPAPDFEPVPLQPLQPAPGPGDDLLVPMVAGKTELLVKLGGGLKGARLFVDNKDVGPLPQTALEVTPGEHTVVVRRPGFSEFSRRITVESGKTNEVAVSLDAVAGVVAVNSDVTGAKVTIDGQPRGQVPLTGIVLKPGSHEIVVSREGFEPDKQTIAVRAGKDYTVNAYLRPAAASKPEPVASADTPVDNSINQPQIATNQPDPLAPLPGERDEVSTSSPLYKRWYFWAGVGAVVTAAAVGTVAATRSPGAEPLTPTQVCGGPCDGAINGIRGF